MHISQMMKILNGQRASEYEALYSEVSLQWLSTSSITFYITSLIGNTIQIDWDDDVENTIIETTGYQQTISMSFSQSKERKIKLKGSGIYTLTQLKITHNSFKSIPIDEDNCMEMPNLTSLNFYQSRYFRWTTTPNWQLLPKLKSLNLYECRYNMTSLPLEDKTNRPQRLQNLDLYYCTSLSSINLSDFDSLKNVKITQLCDNYSSYRGELNLSGCNNLISAFVYGCEYVSGYYFNDCPNLKILNFNNESDSYCRYGQVLDITNDTSLTGLTLHGFGNNIPASSTIELKRGNNTSYSNERLTECYFNTNITPDSSITPNLSAIYWSSVKRVADKLDFSTFNNLKTIEIKECYGNNLSTFTCNNNRSVSSCIISNCYDFKEASIQNCTQLYRLDFKANSWNTTTDAPCGQLQEAKIKNNPSLYQLNMNYNSLIYGLELESCQNLYSIDLCYTHLRSLDIQNFINLYRLSLYSDNNFSSKLTSINIKNCALNRNLDINAYNLKLLKTFTLDTYSNLDDVYLENNTALEKIYITNGTISSFDLTIEDSPNVNYFDFTNNYFSISHMNEILRDINTYCTVDNGTVIFTGNYYGYTPDATYLQPLLNRGWDIIY